MGSLCGTSNTYDRPHNNRHLVRNVPVPVINRTERERVDIEDRFKDFEEFNSMKEF
jgi:hypothetical protein